MKKRVAILGGGISGLTAAYVLHRDYSETCEFTLLEAENRLGGIIETVHAEGFTIECGPGKQAQLGDSVHGNSPAIR